MEQSVGSEAKTSKAIQKKKNPRTLCNPNADDSYFHCHVHNGSPYVNVLWQINPDRALPSYSLRLILILSSRNFLDQFPIKTEIIASSSAQGQHKYLS